MTFPTFPSPFTTRSILYLLQIAVTFTMGIQATYVDDSRHCCNGIRQGVIPIYVCSGYFLAFN